MTESGWSAYEYYIVARQAFASTLEALTYNNQENIVTEEFGTSYGSKTTPYSEVPTGSYWTPCDIIPFDASQNICKIEERFNQRQAVPMRLLPAPGSRAWWHFQWQP